MLRDPVDEGDMPKELQMPIKFVPMSDKKLGTWVLFERCLHYTCLVPDPSPALKNSIGIATDHVRGVDQLLAIPLRAASGQQKKPCWF